MAADAVSSVTFAISGWRRSGVCARFFARTQIERQNEMARYQVTCIVKRGDHYDPHERIQYTGQQNSWMLSEDAEEKLMGSWLLTTAEDI
jgi:hypothetical protein